MNEKAMSVYGALLREIKYRVESIDATLDGHVHVRAKIAEELCYLQLRMICELIAIGCLVIHGDLNLSNNLLKSYEASKIMSEMYKIHPKFFPVPLMPSEDTPGGKEE